MNELEKRLAKLALRIDQSIAQFLPREFDTDAVERFVGTSPWRCDPEVQTAALSLPLWDLMDRRGKHWRPAFGLLLVDALGTPSEPYDGLFAMATEFMHTASLIIDDIQDNAQKRRGGEAIHLRYGMARAINAGNAAYFLPYCVVGSYPGLTDSQRLDIYRILSAQSASAHFGQGQDIHLAEQLSGHALDSWIGDGMGETILQGYAWKTGSIVEGAAAVACVVADTDVDTRQSWADFGREFGVAFQIMDDVLDFTEERLRDGVGGRDLAEGKLTYVVLRALESLQDSERARLGTILCSAACRREPESLREGIELVRASGALQACRAEALDAFNTGWQFVSEGLPSSGAKTVLEQMCAFLLEGKGERSARRKA